MSCQRTVVECEEECKKHPQPPKTSYHCNNVTHTCEEKPGTTGRAKAQCEKKCKPKK